MIKRTILAVIVILLLAVAIYEGILHLKSKGNGLTVSGRVEANETELSARIPGRLSRVFIDDGMKVKKGDPVALIEDDELQSKQRELSRKAEEMIETIKAGELNLSFASNNVAHSIDEARKALAVAEARLRQAEARREFAEKELRRYASLREKEAVSEERYDNVRLSHKLALEEVKTSGEDVERARLALLKAEDSRELVKARERELLGLRKSLQQVREVQTQIEITLGYAKINAPSDGIILRKVSEPGEVLPLGGVVAVMINPDDLHVKTYVPEKYVGMISMNLKAEVFTDAYPREPFTGFICYISDRAEFTPKEVQSYEERVKQVFAVKICFSEKVSGQGKRPYHEVLKKGMPVDVKFGLLERP